MKYKPYSDYDIHLFFSEVREVSDRPYMLHAAFLLSCLFEAYTPDEDNEEELDLEHTWGWKIPQSVLKSIVKNANEQFIEASNHGTQIDIWDKGYSIRKVNAYDKNRLNDIFNFPADADDYIICKEGIMDLAGDFNNNAHDEVKTEFQDNKSYLRKVIMVAEDDAHNGWNKLTDIEVTLYLWTLFYRKQNTDNAVLFREKFDKDLYTSKDEDKQCWNAIAQLNDRPNGLYTFSANKVRKWNEQHEQVSIIDTIDSNKADDYWYNVAVKTSCK
jgi:hypothetical protein